MKVKRKVSGRFRAPSKCADSAVWDDVRALASRAASGETKLLLPRSRLNAYYKPRLTISDAACELGIEVRRDFHHAARAVHDSLLLKMLDDSAFFAANSRILTAEGKEVARGTGTFMSSTISLDGSVGY